MLFLISFYLLFINITQCINPLAHLVKYDEVKRLNFTDLDAKANLTSEYLGFCKHFEMDFDHIIFVVEMETYGKNGFDNIHSIHEIDTAICRTPRPTQTTSSEGEECKNIGGMNQDLPEDITSCLKMYTIMMVASQNNNWKLEKDQGIKYGTLARKDIMMYVHFHTHDQHYLNKVVEFGLRLWHTTQHKPHNIGISPIGPIISFYGVIVPPKQPRFFTVGHCSAECFHEDRPEGIHIIATMPHVHKHAVGQVVRHFRNGNELPPLYNQSISMKTIAPKMIDPVVFKRGDQLTIECIYDTMNENTTVSQTHKTSIKEEMCISMLFYYPYIEDGVSYCGSVMTEDTIIKATQKDIQLEDYWKTPLPKIASPSHLKGMPLTDYFENMTAEDYGSDIQQLLRYSPQLGLCDGMSEWPPKRNFTLQYPKNCQLI